MRRPEWLDWLSILGWFAIFCAVVLWLALSLIGCASAPPLGVSGILTDPFEGQEYARYDDEWGTGTPTLAIWKYGAVSLTDAIAGHRCGLMYGSAEVEVGEYFQVSRAFLGSASAFPQVGDTLAGAVYPSTVIDTHTVAGGGFQATMVAPDTIVVRSYLRLPFMGAACGRDSFARFSRLVRVRS